MHRTESTENSGSQVKLSQYSFSNQQQYNQLFHDWLCFWLWIIGDAGLSPAWGEIQSEPQSAFNQPISAWAMNLYMCTCNTAGNDYNLMSQAIHPSQAGTVSCPRSVIYFAVTILKNFITSSMTVIYRSWQLPLTSGFFRCNRQGNLHQRALRWSWYQKTTAQSDYDMRGSSAW